jgi:hypothetical protein
MNPSLPGIPLATLDARYVAQVGGRLASHYGPTLVTAAGAFDLSAADRHQRTLDGTNGVLTVTGGMVDQIIMLTLIQDGTGGRAVTSWFAGIAWITPTGAAPPLATAAGKINVFTFICYATGAYYGFLSGQNG